MFYIIHKVSVVCISTECSICGKHILSLMHRNCQSLKVFLKEGTITVDGKRLQKKTSESNPNINIDKVSKTFNIYTADFIDNMHGLTVDMILI